MREQAALASGEKTVRHHVTLFLFLRLALPDCRSVFFVAFYSHFSFFAIRYRSSIHKKGCVDFLVICTALFFS